MVEISDSMLSGGIVIIGFLSTLIYFVISRRDRKTSETRTEAKDAGEEDRDKQETARKVKKELTDEAEKVESLRKSVAEVTLTQNQAYTNAKVDSAVTAMKHELELYKQTIESRFSLYGQSNDSKFKAEEAVQNNLLAKMVEIAKVGADSMVKINETVDALRQLLYELAGKVNVAEKKINNKVDK